MKLQIAAACLCSIFAHDALADEPATKADLKTAEMILKVENVSPPPPDQIPKIDPTTLYGNEIVFDVFRKGSKVGSHVTSFERNGADLTVISRFNLAIDVLFFTAYSFDYQSTEVWRDGALVGLAVGVVDGGKKSAVTAKVEDGLFKIEGPRGPSIASSWVFPTNHWNRGQVNSTTILNTITGRLSKVEIIRRGIDRVETAQGPVDAEHFEYTGDLRDTEVWYDADHRWVKMQFKAKDGSTIEYRCLRCGLAPAPAMAEGEPQTQSAREPNVSEPN
ncbi:MAG: DUF6134 family protein [Rhodospirillaceae bacterium]|nr:DUF6134 family protein [Rhodospirillaceae bacterium]